ncbi:uncharacterized protein LOC108679104 isoform X2 [Hyalella azteca]|uniref:Uncharacterized protein LOC108679104 isoform X2 n=1 Tax=Hyalella azteca TaxID=294128 RepID=A0A979FVT0_HYAAZ|nr:uncharacterized protein LOC108679104 isoform X2 [Hyalella azteca]
MPEMKMDGDDISAMAARRKEGRRKSDASELSFSGYTSMSQTKAQNTSFASSLSVGLQKASLAPRKYPSEAVLRIDNFTSGDNTPLSSLSPSPTPPPRVYETKGFLKDVIAREPRQPHNAALFQSYDGSTVSRNSLPPLVTVEVYGTTVAALLHSAQHVSLVSARLVARLQIKKDVQSDMPVPPSPLAPNGSGSAWLIDGCLRYLEISLKGTKFVTQFFVARDLPADIILGVDFLRKTQMRLNFSESCAFFSSGGKDVKIPFLSSKEVSDHQHVASTAARAHSSNF